MQSHLATNRSECGNVWGFCLKLTFRSSGVGKVRGAAIPGRRKGAITCSAALWLKDSSSRLKPAPLANSLPPSRLSGEETVAFCHWRPWNQLERHTPSIWAQCSDACFTGFIVQKIRYQQQTGILLSAVASYHRHKRFVLIGLFRAFALKDVANIVFCLTLWCDSCGATAGSRSDSCLVAGFRPFFEFCAGPQILKLLESLTSPEDPP